MHPLIRFRDPELSFGLSQRLLDRFQLVACAVSPGTSATVVSTSCMRADLFLLQTSQSRYLAIYEEKPCHSTEVTSTIP